MSLFVRGSFFLLLLSSTSQSNAQQGLSKYEIGVGAGLFIYQGDLTPSRLGSYRTPSPVFQIFLNRIVTSSFSLRTSLFSGRLRGNDAAYSNPAWRTQRAFNFHTPVLEISESVVWNPLGTNYRNGSKRSFTPYVFAGLGLAKINSRADATAFNTAAFASEPQVANGLAEDVKHGTPKTLLTIPAGLGLQYDLTQKFTLFAETNYRFFPDGLSGWFQPVGKPGLLRPFPKPYNRNYLQTWPQQ